MTALLTAREVAELLDVSTETVLRWTRAGKLPAIRLPGGAIRFREDEILGAVGDGGPGVRGSWHAPSIPIPTSVKSPGLSSHPGGV